MRSAAKALALTVVLAAIALAALMPAMPVAAADVPLIAFKSRTL